MSGTDALGAPVFARPSDVRWEALRQAVKAVVHDVGVEAVAAQFGISPASLLDAISRNREPGVGRKARFLKVVADNTEVTGNLPDSSQRRMRR